ncbi:MAG: biotin transporter BioY [Aggregatilineales bacterium]
MLRTLPLTLNLTLPQRLAGIALFTLLTAISARISIEIGLEVPFTMQVLVVLLAGMILGARDGALSQLAYVALIVTGMPIDARGLGTAALFGPTGGYLIGFIIAAFVSGFIVEKSGKHLWQRWLAGLAGIAVIYLFGVSHLAMYTGMNISTAWDAGAAPFLLLDMVKALIAAGLVETIRYGLNNRNQ